MAILTMVRHRFWNNDGTLASGGKVQIFEAGTTTAKQSFTDSTGGTPNAWPLICNSKGEAAFWTVGLFKINLLQSDDVQVTGYPVDNCGAITDAVNEIYTPSGTGAVATTVQTKLSEMVSIADFLPAGYVTDGSVDYTTQIQAAINYAQSKKAELRGLPGIWKGNWIISSECTIVGASTNGTIFKPAVNAPVFSLITTASVARVNLSKFWIQGDITMNVQDGISLVPAGTYFADHIKLDSVWITNCGRYGMHTFGSSSGGPFVQALRIESSFISGCIQEGLYMEGEAFECLFTDFWVQNNGTNVIPNCTIGSKTSAGHAPYRVTWIGGGCNQAVVAANARYVSDLVTTATSAGATSATANFVAGDAGKYIAIANGNLQSQPLITTIASVTNSTTIVLTDVANVSNAGGTKAIINLGIGGVVNIQSAKQIKFIGCDFEGANVYAVVSGTLQQNLSFDNCNFGGTYPALATVWSQGGGNGLSVKNYNVTNTVAHFYNLLSAATTGALIAQAAQTQNVDFPATSVASLTSSVAHILMFELQNISANNLTLYQPALNTIRVNGNGTVNNILDTSGGVSQLTHGQIVVVYAYTAGGIVMAHQTGGTLGRLYLNTTANESIPAAGCMILQFDAVFGWWFERSMTRKYGTFTMANANTKTITDANVGATSVITLMPTNAAAATLMGGATSLYISARTAQTSFAVATANAAVAAGTETFAYNMI